MPDAKLSHLWEWGQMVEHVAGHKSYYLIAHDKDKACGVLPVTHVRSRLFGNRLISQAFSSYGGPLAGSPEARECLLDKATELAGYLGCGSVEFRMEKELRGNYYRRDDKVSMRLKLQSDLDAFWRSFKSDTGVRNHIRKGQKAGIESVHGGVELLQDFYKVYTLRMHQLGTPCYSSKIIRGILETFPDNTELVVAKLKGRTIGGRLVCRMNDFVESVWGVTKIEFNHLSPNYVMYWDVFSRHGSTGAKWFDFGPSTVGTSHHSFKRQWGALEFPLHYQIWTRDGNPPVVHSPNNPKYRRRIELWKTLPVWVTRRLGPYISMHLP